MSDPERLGGDATQAAADRRQRAIGVESGAARAAVLGINDGLVTNTALILGVVGATDAGGVVQLAGFASLVAGACSMAVGEYVSMRAQVELLERLLNDELQAMQADPERERAVIRDTLEHHGFEPETAERASRELARNVDRALAVYSRAVLGVNPDELGAPWAAALSSFVAFAAGALIPLLPWYIVSRPTALVVSLALSGIAALGIGGALGYLSNHRVARSALRQLLVVTLASAITFLVGRLFGVMAS
jgi:VIT1/CCC1 family predicted Fe2+/Mn2+ transporter